MGLIINGHGVYVVRRKVPERLQAAVARALKTSKSRQVFLQKTTGTKNLKQAKVIAAPILMEFDAVIARAAASIEERPLVAKLPLADVKRIADYHYATLLADDDAVRREGGTFIRQLGASDVRPRKEYTAEALSEARAAYAAGDLDHIKPEVEELLTLFAVNLDREGSGYRTLSLAVLEKDVSARSVIAERLNGAIVETPRQPEVESYGPSREGNTLSAAFEGWRKERDRSPGTLTEYSRAVTLFTELHGDMAIVDIKRSHARRFREALQEIPRHRPAKLKNTKLPQLADWGREHTDAPKITAPTINKLLGGVQAIVVWGSDKGGMVPDDIAWSDPFARLRLAENESDREPFTPEELKVIFGTPVFTQGARPTGGKGDAAFWLPLLALFTGARRSELAALSEAQVAPLGGESTAILITEDRARGARLKTKGSQRTVPLHKDIIALGFLDYVADIRAKGKGSLLFPELDPRKPSAQKAWTKWFSRYIRNAGVADTAKVFHSFRHNFKDALRSGGVNEDVIDALTGHSNRGSVSRGYGAKDIVRRFGAITLSAAVSEGNFSVNLSGVKAYKRTKRK